MPVNAPLAFSVDKKSTNLSIHCYRGLACGAERYVIASYPFGRCSFPDTFIAGFFANHLLARP
jgi:hypothetical protein